MNWAPWTQASFGFLFFGTYFAGYSGAAVASGVAGCGANGSTSCCAGVAYVVVADPAPMKSKPLLVCGCAELEPRLRPWNIEVGGFDAVDGAAAVVAVEPALSILKRST